MTKNPRKKTSISDQKSHINGGKIIDKSTKKDTKTTVTRDKNMV